MRPAGQLLALLVPRWGCRQVPLSKPTELGGGGAWATTTRPTSALEQPEPSVGNAHWADLLCDKWRDLH